MADFNTAATALLLQSPFFGSLLLKLRHVEKADLNPPTLAVSQSTLYYHPEFMAQCTDAEGVFAVAHEVMHVAWMHLPRAKHYRDTGIGPDGKAYDHKRMNIACDYAVNDSLRETGVGAVPREELIKIHLDPRKYPHTLTPEEIYCLLAQEEENGSGGGGGEDGEEEGPGSFDGHDFEDADGDDAPPVTAADVLQAANVCKAVNGTLPAGIDRLIGELQRPKSSPWAMLRRAVASALSGYDRSSWKRLQRQMIVRGVGVPGRIAEGAGRVGVVGDTSGSIGQEILTLFGRHMAAIMDDARPKEIRVYWTDAKVHRVDTAKSSTQLRQLLSRPVPGGGGTDMRKGVKAAEDDGCDVIVVLTDMYTPFCGAKVPLIWASPTPGLTAPTGKTIHIAE